MGVQLDRSIDRGELLLDLLHIFTLSSFAVAQPLFGLLADNAEFFVIRRSEPIDIIFLAVFLITVVPLPLVVIELLGALAGERVHHVVHGSLVAALVATILLPALKRIDGLGAVGLVVMAVAAGTAVALSYLRFAGLRRYLTYLSPVLVLFPGLFLLNPSVRRILEPDTSIAAPLEAVKSENPIFILVMDEFPLTALLDDKLLIDTKRFPNFSAFASKATWYRRATTVSDSTHHALPALLTGRYPQGNLQPTSRDHPENLFTLFAGAYALRVHEATSQLCPSSICQVEAVGFGERVRLLLSDLSLVYAHLALPDGLTSDLPAVTSNWMNFRASAQPLDWEAHRVANRPGTVDRRSRQSQFVDQIEPTGRPVVWFDHIMLPHLPYSYLPSGKIYNDIRGLVGENTAKVTSWKRLTLTQDYQRFLLQVRFLDSLVGELMRQIERAGLFESSLIVLVADHGASFMPKQFRRKLTDTNFQDILPIPLFIKAPHQSEGRIDDRTFEIIDVLPTMADLLGVEIPWEMDGQSAMKPSAQAQRATVAFSTLHRGWRKHRYAPGQISLESEIWQHQLATFGTGDSQSFWSIGPWRDLIGRTLESLRVDGDSELKLRLSISESELTISQDAAFIPALISGQVLGRDKASGRLPLALLVNDVIRAVVPTSGRETRGDTQTWSAVVPEDSFRTGRNQLKVLLVGDDASPRSLKGVDFAFSDD